VIFRTIQLFSNSYSVSSLCEFFKVSKSGYYKFLKTKNSKDAIILEQIKAVQLKSKQTYGYRRVQIALGKQGYRYNHKKILRVMNKYNLLSKIRRKYMYVKGNVAAHQYANLLSQNFKTKNINEIWNTDVTCIITPEGRLYLSAIRDAYDGLIVAYKYSTIQDLKLVSDTIKLALKTTKVVNTTLHSDQGVQYTSQMYNCLLRESGITPSMSRKATPLDNAPIESFFSSLKTECIYLEKPKTIQQAQELIDEYIDFYNYERIQLKHRASPSEVRKKIPLRLA
jgi:transposase InsO family protein